MIRYFYGVAYLTGWYGTMLHLMAVCMFLGGAIYWGEIVLIGLAIFHGVAVIGWLWVFNWGYARTAPDYL